MSLTKFILLSLAAGIILGITGSYLPDSVFSPINSYVLVPVGKIFLGLIKMLVVPIVFCSIVMGVFQLGNPKKIGRIGGKSIVFFLCTTAIAISIAIAVAYLIKPGQAPGLETAAAQAPQLNKTSGLIDMLVGIIPENPISALASGNMLQIIFFSTLFGFGISLLGNKVDGLKNAISQINDVLMKIIHIVMYTAPAGAFALIASAIGTNGPNTLKQMAMYVVAVILALIIHFIFTYGLALRILGKMGLLTFVRKFYPAMIVGFSTSSSSATLPISMEVAQTNLKVSPSVSSFVQSLGSTINMDGTAIMQGVATIFISQVYHIDLSFVQILTVILTAVLASIGTAGVPAVGLVMLMMVLNQVGLPVEGIALIIGVDRILDMLRTSVNITGDAICAVIIDRSEKARI